MRTRQKLHDSMIREAALVLAAELAQQQQEACLAASMDESFKMNWLAENLRSRWPIFIIAASWFPSAGDGVPGAYYSPCLDTQIE